jgi:hypothetical protein
MLILLCGLLGAVSTPGGMLGDDSPRAARLLAQGDAPPLVSAPPPDAGQLRFELDRLLRRKPSYGLPVSLLATGGGIALGGAFYLIIAAASPFATMAMTVVGVVALSLGVSLAGFGAVFMVWRVRDREAWAEDVDALSERLRAAQGGGTPRPRTGALEVPLATLARF